jgi:hypothetical protein
VVAVARFGFFAVVLCCLWLSKVETTRLGPGRP